MTKPTSSNVFIKLTLAALKGQIIDRSIGSIIGRSVCDPEQVPEHNSSASFYREPSQDMSKKLDELHKSYLKTIYWIDGLDCAVRIGRYCEPAHKLIESITGSSISEEGAVLLSASNPFGEVLSFEENMALQTQLLSAMKEHSLLLDVGRGMAQEPDERGQIFWEPFCVVGPVTEKTAREIAAQYKQVAVVFFGTKNSAKLVFADMA